MSPQFTLEDYLQTLTAATLGFLSFNPHLKPNPSPRWSCTQGAPALSKTKTKPKFFTALGFFGSLLPAQVQL